MSSQQVYEVSAAPTKEGVLDAFAQGLDFPEYFGRNLDALADCLGEFADSASKPATVLWTVDATFKGTRAYGLILEILNEVAADSKRKSPGKAFTFTVQDQPQNPIAHRR